MGLLRTLTAAAAGAALYNWWMQQQQQQQRDPQAGAGDRPAPLRWRDEPQHDRDDTDTAARPGSFVLDSRDIKAGGTIDARFEFNGFDCGGDNKSPALDWHGAPDGTQSYALTFFDPDAPTGSGWWHWLVLDIPAHVSGLNADAGSADGKLLPDSARQLRNDFGQPGFGGPCPPRGDAPHRYRFTLHALKVPKLDIPDDASAALAGFMIHANSLGQAGFTAHYGRPGM